MADDPFWDVLVFFDPPIPGRAEAVVISFDIVLLFFFQKAAIATVKHIGQM